MLGCPSLRETGSWGRGPSLGPAGVPYLPSGGKICREEPSVVAEKACPGHRGLLVDGWRNPLPKGSGEAGRKSPPGSKAGQFQLSLRPRRGPNPLPSSVAA